MQVFVESLDRAFENVCELDLVFHFDEVGNFAYDIGFMAKLCFRSITFFQGGLVLETNVEEIDQAGRYSYLTNYTIFPFFTVQEAARARKDSYSSSNPLSLGGGGLTPRGPNMKTPLSWITGKLTGSG